MGRRDDQYPASSHSQARIHHVGAENAFQIAQTDYDPNKSRTNSERYRLTTLTPI
jgi:hypothetical protein